MKEIKRFLMIGAHPDDADVQFGGTAAMLVQAGHAVKFVSLTNGNCGHYELSGDALAKRHYAETQASKAVSDISSRHEQEYVHLYAEQRYENRKLQRHDG